MIFEIGSFKIILQNHKTIRSNAIIVFYPPPFLLFSEHTTRHSNIGTPILLPTCTMQCTWGLIWTKNCHLEISPQNVLKTKRLYVTRFTSSQYYYHIIKTTHKAIRKALFTSIKKIISHNHMHNR